MYNRERQERIKPVNNWQDQEIIYDFRAQLQGTGSRSDVFRYD